MICNAWDVIIVPFPFVDSHRTKRRPALVISRKDFNRHGHTICAMITTKRQPAWPGDFSVSDLNSAGLPRACIVRPKLFTLDNRLLAERIGRLGDPDRDAAKRALAGTVAI